MLISCLSYLPAPARPQRGLRVRPARLPSGCDRLPSGVSICDRPRLTSARWAAPTMISSSRRFPVSAVSACGARMGLGATAARPMRASRQVSAVVLERDPGAYRDDRTVQRLSAHDLEEGRACAWRGRRHDDFGEEFARLKRCLVRAGGKSVKRSVAHSGRRVQRQASIKTQQRRDKVGARRCLAEIAADGRHVLNLPGAEAARRFPQSQDGRGMQGVSQLGDREQGADPHSAIGIESPIPGIFHRLTTC